MQIAPVQSGKLPRDLLRSDGVFVLDSGFHVYLWVGNEASFPKRVTAFTFAQAYLKQFQRPAALPLTRFAEGQESQKAFAFLNKRPTSEAGPSGRSVHTHEAPSPLKESPKKKRYGPKNWTPTTPPGLSPSKRNGKNAAIICWTPGNSN